MSRKNATVAAPKLVGFNELSETTPYLLNNTPPAPKIVGVRPTGSQVLIELLTAQEALGTNFIVGDQSEVGSPQAYVLDFGPGLKDVDVSVKVGDRVLLQGSYVPVPKFDDNPRKRGLVELHGIKAVLEESK
jgi:co-chaperonin GroES (HSP10)